MRLNWSNWPITINSIYRVWLWRDWLIITTVQLQDDSKLDACTRDKRYEWQESLTLLHWRKNPETINIITTANCDSTKRSTISHFCGCRWDTSCVFIYSCLTCCLLWIWTVVPNKTSQWKQARKKKSVTCVFQSLWQGNILLSSSCSKDNPQDLFYSWFLSRIGVFSLNLALADAVIIQTLWPVDSSYSISPPVLCRLQINCCSVNTRCIPVRLCVILEKNRREPVRCKNRPQFPSQWSKHFTHTFLRYCWQFLSNLQTIFAYRDMWEATSSSQMLG